MECIGTHFVSRVASELFFHMIPSIFVVRDDHTFNVLFVITGDFLLARVSVTLSSLESTGIIKMISCILEDLVSGEIMQV